VKPLKLLPALLVLGGLVWLALPRGASRAGAELRVVSPHWEGIREEFGTAFEEHWRAKTGKSLRVVFLDLGGTSKCMRFIRSRPPGESRADLVFGGGVDNYVALAEEGYLEGVEVPPRTLSEIPLAMGGYPLRDEGGRWFAACLSSFGICYNKEVLRREKLPVPREWEDLADPRFYNWVGSGEPRSSGTVHMCYEMILQTYGWEKGFELVTRMAGNVRAFNEGGGGVPRDVALGQFAAGGSIDFYALERVICLGSDSVGYVVPMKMPVINGDPVAVIRGAPHAEAAAEFVRFVLSEPGQKLWFARPGEPDGPRSFALGRLPVWRSLCGLAGEQLEMTNPYEMKGLGGWDSRKNGRRWVILNALLGAAVIEPHDRLRGAWRALLEAGCPPEGLKEFGAPPCDEEEFMRLAGWFGDKAVKASDKNAKVAEWGVWARKKYGRVAARYARRPRVRAQ
jgi:ABC-type Fe3+ transport system substrate-binding protein